MTRYKTVNNVEVYPKCIHIRSWNNKVCDGRCGNYKGKDKLCSTHSMNGTCPIDEGRYDYTDCY